MSSPETTNSCGIGLILLNIMSLDIDIIYTNDIFRLQSSDTTVLERCFVLLDFKIYNVFLPMNVSTLKYNVFPTF